MRSRSARVHELLWNRCRVGDNRKTARAGQGQPLRTSSGEEIRPRAWSDVSDTALGHQKISRSGAKGYSSRRPFDLVRVGGARHQDGGEYISYKMDTAWCNGGNGTLRFNATPGTAGANP